MTYSGKLIVFEGPDRAGKTTLAKELVTYLTERRIDTHYFAFPGTVHGTLGKLVYQLHHSPTSFGVHNIGPTSMQLMHVAAHIDAIEATILPVLSRGHWVVLDRFWLSTLVYGRLTNADDASLNYMVQIERLHWRLIEPTLLFLVFREPVETDSPHPLEQRRIHDEYLRAAHDLPIRGIVRHINNSRSVQDTLCQVIDSVRPLLLDLPHNGPPVSTTRSGLSPHRAEARHTRSFRSLSPAKPTIVYDTYWKFACERQAIFFRRLTRKAPPWTDDPILREFKFTNAYRASDRVSQYLIREVLYEGEQSFQEIFFRALIFKTFNRIETWRLLTREFGAVSYRDYKFEHYDKVLSGALARGERIYSAAYIMPTGRRASEITRKHHTHLRVIEQMMRDDVPAKLTAAPSMRKAFAVLRSYPTIGDFLAYQYTIDLNYSRLTNFSEMDFVVPGPGARDGIRKCFADLGGLNEAEIIRFVAERQDQEFARPGLVFQSLWGRPLQLVDCQNLFCEVDKYARLKHPEFAGRSGRTRIKQRYKANQEPISFWYPPKWGINECAGQESGNVQSI